MNGPARLAEKLEAVDFNALVGQYCADVALLSSLHDPSLNLAIWARQIETVDVGNPALPFVRAAQLEVQDCAALVALSLYKPGASSMRAAFESVLYYSYFRSHFEELRSLITVDEYYISKAEVLEYHKLHSPGFMRKAGHFDLLARINKWYSAVSLVVHGQVPGAWTQRTTITGLCHDPKLRDDVLRRFKEGLQLCHLFLLVTVNPEVWRGFTLDAREQLLSGVKGDAKVALGLSLS